MQDPTSLEAGSHRTEPTPAGGAPILATGALAAGFNLVLLAVLIGFVWLKEDPMFWRNAGGWPVWLRETVLWGFYPLLALEAAVLAGLTRWSRGTLQALRPREALAALAVLALSWGLAGLVVLLLVANNLANLFQGRPTHWHGP